MFAISPRLSVDDFGLFRLADELSNYCDRSPQAFGLNRESEVQNTDKEFRIRFDLKHYKPEEIKITSDNQRLTVHAKHEEKQDNHSFVSREICRVYKLPEDVDAKSITSSLNSNGVLSIKATKRAIEAPKETAIPVEFAK
ncbi:unnamed protein product [Lymnaea stagnalis]|uniref:SHSP domain-containing protein n=1 Tax=Lymnaea stagnalis TaxID=6523 RepID=A0AAV2IDK8_LYMST